MGMLFGRELDGKLARTMLLMDGYIGGAQGANAVRSCMQAGAAMTTEAIERAERAEAALELAQAALRAPRPWDALQHDAVLVPMETVRELQRLARIEIADTASTAVSDGKLAAAVLAALDPS